VLLKTVAPAHCWFSELVLVTGRSRAMMAIVKREGVGKRYVGVSRRDDANPEN
jgi:hypothetical protein